MVVEIKVAVDEGGDGRMALRSQDRHGKTCPPIDVTCFHVDNATQYLY